MLNDTTYTSEASYVGVDWITVTSKGFTGCILLGDVARSVANETVGENAIEYSEWRMHGYLGWTTKTVNFGTRTDGAALQIKSGAANDYFDRVCIDGVKATRLDLQVTIELNPYRNEFCYELYRKLMNSDAPSNQRKYTYMVDIRGSDTLNVGSRQSEQYGRVYDKYRQSGKRQEYLHSYRFEVELKGDRAQEMFLNLRDIKDKATFIHDFVLAWFADRNVVVPNLTLGNSPSIMKLRDYPTNLEKKLEWLKKQVSPTVQQLILQGFDKEVWEAFSVRPIDGKNESNQEQE
jgi:hypothetical protein